MLRLGRELDWNRNLRSPCHFKRDFCLCAIFAYIFPGKANCSVVMRFVAYRGKAFRGFAWTSKIFYTGNGYFIGIIASIDRWVCLLVMFSFAVVLRLFSIRLSHSCSDISVVSRIDCNENRVMDFINSPFSFSLQSSSTPLSCYYQDIFSSSLHRQYKLSFFFLMNKRILKINNRTSVSSRLDTNDHNYRDDCLCW